MTQGRVSLSFSPQPVTVTTAAKEAGRLPGSEVAQQVVFSASFLPADHLVLTGAFVPSGASSEPPKGVQPRQSHPQGPFTPGSDEPQGHQGGWGETAPKAASLPDRRPRVACCCPSPSALRAWPIGWWTGWDKHIGGVSLSCRRPPPNPPQVTRQRRC